MSSFGAVQVRLGWGRPLRRSHQLSRLWLAVAVVFALCLGLIGSVDLRPAHADAGDLQFVPLSRVASLEQRVLAAGEVAEIQVAGRAAVPSNARAVMFDLVAAHGTAPSTFLTLWKGGARPSVSTIIAAESATIQNTAVVALSSSGSVSIYNNVGTITAALNVQGYFVDAPGAGAGGFVALNPARILDTRNSVPIPAGGTLDVRVTGVGGVAAGAQSVFVNLVAAQPTEPGSVSITTRGVAPSSAGPSYSPGASVAQAVSVKPDAAGYATIKNYQATGTVHVLLDVQGFFSDDSTENVFRSANARVHDSRLTEDGPLAAGQTREVSLSAHPDLPWPGMAAVFANVIVLNPSGNGGLKVWSADETEPSVNNVIFDAGTSHTVMLATKVSLDGSVFVKNPGTLPFSFVLDVQGWFVDPPPSQPTVTSAQYPANQTASSGGAGTFTFTSNADAVSARYRFDDQEWQSVTFTASGANRVATVSFTPPIGWHVLSVMALDLSGNRSLETYHEFGYDTGTDEKPDGLPPPTTAPPEPVDDPPPTADPAAPAVVRGKLVQLNGTAASNFTVKIYPPLITDVPDDEVFVESVEPIATATSNADGTWSATLPNPLPAALQAEAVSNGGVLNVHAVAEGSAATDSRPFVASRMVPVGITIGGQLSEAAINARLQTPGTAKLLPILRSGELPTAPSEKQLTALDRAYEDNLDNTPEYPVDPDYTFRRTLNGSAGGSALVGPGETVNPGIVGPTDYTSTSITAAQGSYDITAPGDAEAVSSAAGCTRQDQILRKKNPNRYGYTDVMEAHANWDAKATAKYSQVGNTDVSGGISYNHRNTWAINGGVTISNSTQDSRGYNEIGPKFAKRLKVPMLFYHYTWYICKYNGQANAYVAKYQKETIQAKKIKTPPGGYRWKYGKDMKHKDGYTNWAKATFKQKEEANGGYDTMSGRTSTFGGAMSVLGFTGTASTSRSANRYQSISMGPKNSTSHDIFAWQDLDEASKVKVFYSW